MDRKAIEQEIRAQLRAREKTVLNRNAVGALFGAFADPIGALGKIFVGRDDALDAEKQKIAQGVMLDLLCNIDQAISKAAEESAIRRVTLAGLIETNADHAESVVGVSIGDGSGAVTFKPGTHIRTAATNSKSVTGLKIGGKE